MYVNAEVNFIRIYISQFTLIDVCEKIFFVLLLFTMKLLKVHCIFANWPKSGGILAKVRRTFANWRNSTECIGESTVDFRQWRKSYWRKSYWRNSGTPLNELLLCLGPSHFRDIFQDSFTYFIASIPKFGIVKILLQLL